MFLLSTTLPFRPPAIPLLLLLFGFAAVLALVIVACGGESTVVQTEPPPTPEAAGAGTATPTATRPPDTLIPAATATRAPTATATSTPPPTPTPWASPTPTPRPTARPDGALVSLPEDEAPHETPIEWWYFNGFVWDEAGSEYSFHFVTFQSPTLAVGTPHLLHATLGDHGAGTHGAEERGTLASLEADAVSVDVDAEGWVMRGDGEGYDLRFEVAGKALELRADSRREVVLHDSTGLVDLGEAGETYYYSRTRMEYEGWVEDAEGRRRVTGSGWMDHQWGDISRVDVGWDWVNLQLDDGTDLMVAVVWRPPDQRREAAYTTFVAADGAAIHVPGDGVELEATGAWLSPETGIEYPMGWRLEIAPLEVELELEPVLEHAEFAAGVILPVVYWEGAVTASGQRGGAPVEGRGFVELVGYDPDQATADIPAP